MKRRLNLTKKIHVLHVVTALSWRGGEQQAAYLIGELEKENIEQTVLCSSGSEMEKYCQKHSINNVSFPKRSSFSLSFSKALSRLCKKLEIDLCHLHDAHAHTFAIIAASFFGNQTPLILSRRVDFPIRKSWASNYKYNHPAIKRILCVSEKIKEITSKGIAQKEKLVTVYSGIDLSKFKKTGKLRDELKLDEGIQLIGNTSALADHKDYFTFVDVAETVLEQKPNCIFPIFGTGPLEEEIKQYIQQKELDHKILLMGFRSDIPEVLGDLDVFLMTSKTEGLGTSVIDSFAAGVPVVSTNAGGIPELLEDCITGILCEVKDVNCLSEGVLYLINNKEKISIIAQRAKEKAKRFSKEETAKKTLSIYLDVLKVKVWD